MSSRETGAPQISVITPARNAATFIVDAVLGVAAQGDVCYEHIVVDDGSTDETPRLLAKLASRDARLRIIRLEKSIGSIAARNIGIENAQGRFLAFLDADDIWLPGKLSAQHAFMQQRGLAMSFTDYRHMSHDGRLVGKLISGPDKVDWHIHHTSRYIGCLTVMLDRALVRDFRFPSVFPAIRGEDFLAWSNVLRGIKYAYRCPGDYARYRILKISRSSNKPRAVVSVWRLYRQVEKIPFLNAALFMARFAVSAALKHVVARPTLPRSNFDQNYLARSDSSESLPS